MTATANNYVATPGVISFTFDSRTFSFNKEEVAEITPEMRDLGVDNILKKYGFNQIQYVIA